VHSDNKRGKRNEEKRKKEKKMFWIFYENFSEGV
jgi:hypothetical protein